MRTTGGGNVIAYNYMDDSYGATYPQSSEAGLNAGHYTTPHMELLEGNYSHNYKGDSYWGNSINITVFRNLFSGLRAAHPPLDTYVLSLSNGCVLKYGDYAGRTPVDVGAYSYNTNFVGNVLGTRNQQLLGYDSHSCFVDHQTSWSYEDLEGPVADSVVSMWKMGADQSHQAIDGRWAWVGDTHK